MNRDEKMTVGLVMKYLVNKLHLDSESEVFINNKLLLFLFIFFLIISLYIAYQQFKRLFVRFNYEYTYGYKIFNKWKTKIN